MVVNCSTICFLHVCQIATALFKQLTMLLDRSLEINKNSFSLLLCDAAEYMVAAGAILKSLYPKMFHSTSVADLSSFSLLLSGAAEYMVNAGAILKSLYSKLFYTTCVADLSHACAMKIKSYFEDVNQLIGKVKLARVDNKPDKPNSLLLVAHSACYHKMGKLDKFCCISYKEFS